MSLQFKQRMHCHCLGFSHASPESHPLIDDRAASRWIPNLALSEKKIGEELTLVYVPPHPLIKHWLSVLRNELSSTPVFRFIRDEITFHPILYLNKLPDRFPDGVRVLVADLMLATGGSVIATIDLLKQRNVDHRLIRVVSAAAAPPALDKLSKKFPGLRIYTGTVDEEVSEEGDIVPGLGDAGDHSYGT